MGEEIPFRIKCPACRALVGYEKDESGQQWWYCSRYYRAPMHFGKVPRDVEGWSSPGLVDTQLSPSKTGVGVFNAKKESPAGEAAEVYARVQA